MVSWISGPTLLLIGPGSDPKLIEDLLKESLHEVK